MRDKSTCPSFSNLKNKDTEELAHMLVTALEGQISALETVPNHDTDLLDELRVYLDKINKSYKKILDHRLLSSANTDKVTNNK